MVLTRATCLMAILSCERQAGRSAPEEARAPCKPGGAERWVSSVCQYSRVYVPGARAYRLGASASSALQHDIDEQQPALSAWKDA